MDVDNDGIPAEEMTRAYDDTSDSESSEEAVSAVSRGGARLDSTGKNVSGRASSLKKLQAGAYVLKGQSALCFGQLRPALCLPPQKESSKPASKPSAGGGGAAAAAETVSTGLSATAQPSGAPKRARPDRSAELDLDTLMSTLDASSIPIPPRHRIMWAPVTRTPKQRMIEEKLSELLHELRTLTLKVSAASDKAVVDVSESLDAALLGINKAGAAAAHKCVELKCILKAHSQLEVLSDEGVAVLASGNVICLICTAYGIKTARCARSKSLALRAESSFSPRCARNQK